jgi:hypothetical protein
MMRSILVAFILTVLLVPASSSAQERQVRGGRQREEFTGKHGPYRVDMWYVQNAFIMRKVRPELFYLDLKHGGDGWSAPIEFEWAIMPTVSLGARAGYNSVDVSGDARETGISDTELNAKWALLNGETLIFSLFGAATAPTGDEEKGLGEGIWTAEFSARLWLPFGPHYKLEFQLDAPIEIPLEGDEKASGGLNAALAYTTDFGLTVLVENVLEYSLEEGSEASWLIAPGFQFQIPGGWMAGANVSFPVTGPVADEENIRIVLGFLKEWEPPWAASEEE